MNSIIQQSTAAEAIVTLPAITVTDQLNSNDFISQPLSLFKCKSMLSIVKPLNSNINTNNNNNSNNKHLLATNNAENQLKLINSNSISSKNLSITPKQTQTSLLGNQLSLLSSTNLMFSSSRRISRKCLSRINLNLLNSNKTFDNNHNHNNNQAASMSIMNLDKYLMNDSHNNENNISNTNNKSQSTRLYYFKSSQMNLSTSLNALLDLDMLDSVSIGSFDRHSLYSLCDGAGMSDCDLSEICLIESTNDLFNSSKNITTSNNTLIKSKPNSKVIDWLQKI
jgi:hypothetical protein